MTAVFFSLVVLLLLSGIVAYLAWRNGGNKLMDGGVILLVAIFVIAIAGSQVYRLSDKPHHTGNPAFVGHDDTIEEVLEVVHGALTGSQEDFTPESPES